MKLKLIALALVCCVFIFSSCNKDGGEKVRSNYNIAMTPAQVVPAPPTSAASGRVEASYEFKTRLLTYKIYWYSLSSAVTSIHVHGIADPGLPAAAVQTITGFSTATTGTYTGTLFVDGSAIRESDLLAGVYYMDIHTTNNPQGELRGQIVFGR
jgi:hypothetical protein